MELNQVADLHADMVCKIERLNQFLEPAWKDTPAKARPEVTAAQKQLGRAQQHLLKAAEICLKSKGKRRG